MRRQGSFRQTAKRQLDGSIHAGRSLARRHDGALPAYERLLRQVQARTDLLHPCHVSTLRGVRVPHYDEGAFHDPNTYHWGQQKIADLRLFFKQAGFVIRLRDRFPPGVANPVIEGCRHLRC
jgi:hypothetical protein